MTFANGARLEADAHDAHEASTLTPDPIDRFAFTLSVPDRGRRTRLERLTATAFAAPKLKDWLSRLAIVVDLPEVADVA